MTDLIKPMAEFSVEGPLKSISFDIGSYNVVISESIVVQWIVMLVLGIVFFILGRNLKVRSTSRRQMAAEYLVNFFNNMVRDTMGEKYRKYTPLYRRTFLLLDSFEPYGSFRLQMSDLGPFRNSRMGHHDIRSDAQEQAENRRYQGLSQGLHRAYAFYAPVQYNR